MKKLLIYIMCLLLINPLYLLADTENVDEMLVRKARQATNSFDKDVLEDSSNYYYWQPETFCYKDTTTGKEVWRLTSTNGIKNIFHDSLSVSPWSADGNRIAFNSKRNTNAYTKDTVAATGLQDGGVWMTLSSDGTKMRNIVNGVKREYWAGKNGPFWTWDPATPDVSYDFSSSKHGQTSTTYMLYKGTISDTSDSRVEYQIFPSWTDLITVNKTLGHDGKNMMGFSQGEDRLFPYSIENQSFTVGGTDFTGGISTNRPHGATAAEQTYWGETAEDWEGALHGWGLNGVAANQWYNLQPSGTSIWRYPLLGSAPDGSGNYIHDPTWDAVNKYTWLNTDSTWYEGGPLLVGAGTNEPWRDAITLGASYDDPQDPSHTGYDRWGVQAFFNSTNTPGTPPSIWDTQTKTWVGQFPGFYQHGSNRAWSDRVIWTTGLDTASNPDEYTNDRIVGGSTKDFISSDLLCYTHTLYNNVNNAYAGATYEYNSIARPSLSPDGTKSGYHSTFLNFKYPDFGGADITVASGTNTYTSTSTNFLTGGIAIAKSILMAGFTNSANNGWKYVTAVTANVITVSNTLVNESAGNTINITRADSQPDIYFVVAYYPYAPEITATSATAGTATITFDWQNALTDPNPRTYTDRGWPDETTDDRPIPRETNKYRLWRSTDKITWTPISTVDANHFTRFDFADGGFKAGQDSFWEITDTPGDGTFYYAVTSIEHSGLESRSLSNIFSITVSAGSGTGAQDTVYPTDPGGDASFLTTYNSDLHRYYNLYAEDGATPTASQVNRIASDSRTTKSFIDWLGKTDGTTEYIVTAVDTMGNESAALDTTSVYQQAPATAAGQYTVTWTDTLDTNPVVTLQADKQATSPTTYTFEFSVEPTRIAATVVSSGGGTVTCDDGNCFDDETETGVVSNVPVPSTDVLTVTDSSAETGNDSIILTLPTPETSVGTMNGTVNGNFR